MEHIISALVGYFLGSISMATIISKRKGIKIKEIGSRNAGASNVFMCVGKSYGVIVALFDIFKSFAAFKIVNYVFMEETELAIFASFMAIVGHIFPVWTKFKGGKGTACFFGLLLAYDFKAFVVISILFLAVMFSTDYIVLGTLTLIYSSLIAVIFMHRSVVIIIIFAVTALLITAKHIENIKRIINHTEYGVIHKNKDKK